MASDVKAEVIREYRKSDKEAIFKLFGEVWGGSAAEMAVKRWDWQYELNPANCKNISPILITEYENRIVGMVSSFWVSVKIGHEISHVLWCVDFLAHPDFRGRQGIKLTKILLSSSNFVMGFPIATTFKLWNRQGGLGLCQLYSYKKILNMDIFLQKKIKNKMVTALGAFFWESLWKTILFFQSIGKNNISIVPVAGFDEQIDAFWERVSKDYKNIVVRDKKYLNWRFVDIPNRKYSILLAKRDKNITGYIVYRIGDDNGLRSGHIVDFLVKPDDKETLQCLVNEVLRSMQAEKADLVNCMIATANTMFLNVLKRNGFIFKTREKPGMYFNGCDYISTEDIKKPEEWFFTAGDSDLDIV